MGSNCSEGSIFSLIRVLGRDTRGVACGSTPRIFQSARISAGRGESVARSSPSCAVRGQDRTRPTIRFPDRVWCVARTTTTTIKYKKVGGRYRKNRWGTAAVRVIVPHRALTAPLRAASLKSRLAPHLPDLGRRRLAVAAGYSGNWHSERAFGKFPPISFGSSAAQPPRGFVRRALRGGMKVGSDQSRRGRPRKSGGILRAILQEDFHDEISATLLSLTRSCRLPPSRD